MYVKENGVLLVDPLGVVLCDQRKPFSSSTQLNFLKVKSLLEPVDDDLVGCISLSCTLSVSWYGCSQENPPYVSESTELVGGELRVIISYDLVWKSISAYVVLLDKVSHFFIYKLNECFCLMISISIYLF